MRASEMHKLLEDKIGHASYSDLETLKDEFDICKMSFERLHRHAFESGMAWAVFVIAKHLREKVNDGGVRL